MSKIPYMPPNIPLPDIPKLSEEDIENLKNLKLSDEKKAYIYEKYEKPLREQEQRKAAEKLKRKKERRSEWWRNNWVPFVAMIFAFISALPYIIQGIETILKWLIQWNQ